MSFWNCTIRCVICSGRKWYCWRKTRAGETVGFALGLPDRLDPTNETLIVKTVAVRPEQAGTGLGRLLVGGVQAAGTTLGFRRVIHALMHDGNGSRHLSARFGTRLLRRYRLFSRRLT